MPVGTIPAIVHVELPQTLLQWALAGAAVATVVFFGAGLTLYFERATRQRWVLSLHYGSMLLAAVQTVPQELHEAAHIDGAAAWKRFRYVTLPLIRPTLLVVLIQLTLLYFNMVTLVFTLTGGIFKDAPHPNAAKLFMEFLYSIEASEINAKHFNIPLRPEGPGAPGTQPISKIKVIRPTVEEVAKGIPEVIEQWRDTFI